MCQGTYFGIVQLTLDDTTDRRIIITVQTILLCTLARYDSLA